MLLGDLIARIGEESVANETLLSLGDIVLMARVQELASQEDLTPGELAASAVQQFAAAASDEDWVTLLGQMGSSEDPGRVFLKRALGWMLGPDLSQSAPIFRR